MDNACGASCRFHFAGFEVDVSPGELRKDGRKLRLKEQPLQILAVLLERRGEVVTGEELRRKLWPTFQSLLSDPRFVKLLCKAGLES